MGGLRPPIQFFFLLFGFAVLNFWAAPKNQIPPQKLNTWLSFEMSTGICANTTVGSYRCEEKNAPASCEEKHMCEQG